MAPSLNLNFLDSNNNSYYIASQYYIETEMNSFSQDTGIGCAAGSGLSLKYESNDILLYLKNDSQLSIYIIYTLRWSIFC